MLQPGSRRKKNTPFQSGGVGPPSLARLVLLLGAVVAAIWWLLRLSQR
jgi:hypothetical protein